MFSRGRKRAPPEATAATMNRNLGKNGKNLINKGLQNLSSTTSNSLGNKPFKNAGVESSLIKLTGDAKAARQGLFAWTGTRLDGRDVPTANEIENAHRLMHWNPSHEAAASGSFAEGPAIIAGIQTWAGGPTRSRNQGNGRTVRYIKHMGGGGLVNVDVIDCFKIPGRMQGVNPLNMIFKQYVPVSVLPWHLSVNGERYSYTNRNGAKALEFRDAHATYFQKSRIDWNFLKLWCGANDACLDGTEVPRQSTNGKPRKAATLPTRLGGDLTSADEERLKSGIIQGMWPHVSNADDRSKNAQLKNLIKSIVEKEPTDLKTDSKGPTGGENDIEIVLRVIEYLNGRPVVKRVHIKGESKVSTGAYEVYPGEAAQLLKKHVADNLYLNCRYPGPGNSQGVTIKLIDETRNFFAAWGVGAFKEDYEFTPMHKEPGPQVQDGPRKRAIQAIVRNFRTLFGANGGGWKIERLGTPGLGAGRTSPARANQFFPYCDYNRVYTSILEERTRAEGVLSRQLASWEGRRLAKLIVDPVTSDAFFAGLWEADQLYHRAGGPRRGAAYFQQKHAVDVYGKLAKEFRYQLSALMNGKTVRAIEAIYKKGGGAAPFPTENRKFNNNWRLGRISRGVRNGAVELEPYFVRRGPAAAAAAMSGLITQNNINKRGVKPALCALYIQALMAMQAYMAIQYEKISEIPVDELAVEARGAIRNDLIQIPFETIKSLTSPDLMDFAKHFVVGVSEISPYNNTINGIPIYIYNRPNKMARTAARPQGRTPVGASAARRPAQEEVGESGAGGGAGALELARRTAATARRMSAEEQERQRTILAMTQIILGLFQREGSGGVARALRTGQIPIEIFRQALPEIKEAARFFANQNRETAGPFSTWIQGTSNRNFS